MFARWFDKRYLVNSYPASLFFYSNNYASLVPMQTIAQRVAASLHSASLSHKKQRRHCAHLMSVERGLFLVNHPNPTLQDSGTLVEVGISTFSIWTSILERVGSRVILRCSQWFAGNSLIKILAESRWREEIPLRGVESESLKEVNFCMTCHGRWKWTLLCKISTCLHHTTYLSLFIAGSNKQTHISSRSTSACVATYS